MLESDAWTPRGRGNIERAQQMGVQEVEVEQTQYICSKHIETESDRDRLVYLINHWGVSLLHCHVETHQSLSVVGLKMCT